MSTRLAGRLNVILRGYLEFVHNYSIVRSDVVHCISQIWKDLALVYTRTIVNHGAMR